MLDFFYECFLPVNIAFTLLLLAVFAYWTLIVVGAVGLDTFDLDLDTGADFDLDAGDLDAGDLDAGESFAHTTPLTALLRFFHLGEVPVMIVVSFFVVAMWTVSLLVNRFLNYDNIWWIALIWLVPNVLLSLMIAKGLTMPFRSIFRYIDSGIEPRTRFVGKTCVIKSGHATPEYGQAELFRADGVPLLLNVQTRPGVILEKGDVALLVARNAMANIYTVEKHQPENPS